MSIDDSKREAWLAMQQQASLRSQPDLGQQELPLFGGGGGGTSQFMDVVDAKIAAAEARTDTKFAELRGDLQRLPGKATIWGAVGTIVASLLAIAGIFMAVMAFGGGRFDSGMSTRAAIQSALSQQDAAQTQRDTELRKSIEALSDQQHRRAQSIK